MATPPENLQIFGGETTIRCWRVVHHGATYWLHNPNCVALCGGNPASDEPVPDEFLDLVNEEIDHYMDSIRESWEDVDAINADL